MRVNQVCARVEYGDAVSSHVLEIDRALKEFGYETAIYTESFDQFGETTAMPDVRYAERLQKKEDILIYHYSVYSPNIDLYLRSKNRKILVYHNITPPEFFEKYDPGVAELLRLGREKLTELKGCELAVGDSEFNRGELLDAGFDSERTDVLPIFVNFERLRRMAPVSPGSEASGNFRVIFVGRLVPNKRIEDVIKTFYYYKRCVNPKSELVLVGSSWLKTYDTEIRFLIDSLSLPDCVTVTGRVSERKLASLYASSDVFLSMSEHEGFGVPFVESMAFDIPVIAYASSAVEETLKGAGLIFREKDYAAVGEMMDLLRNDKGLRERVINAQRNRLMYFSGERIRKRLRELMERVAD